MYTSRTREGKAKLRPIVDGSWQMVRLRTAPIRAPLRWLETAVSELLVTTGGLRAAYCAGRLTLFDGGRISGSTEMPEHSAELGDCGVGVLAWQSNSVWVVESSGRVQVVAETDRPIRRVWGHSGGFYVLASELSSFQVRRSEAGRGMKK